MRTSKVTAVARRRWWIVVLITALGAGSAYGFGATRNSEWTTTAVLLVHAGQQSEDGTFIENPNDAVRRASTYSQLLTRDDQLLSAAAIAARIPPEFLEEHLVVQNVSDSALIEVTIAAETLEQAQSMLEAFVTSAIEPATTSIEPGALEVIRVVPPEADTALTQNVLGMVGALLGMMLGVAVVVFAERSDPRIDVAADVHRLVDLPVSTEAEYARSRGAIERRWNALGGHGDHVAVVAAGRADASAVLVEAAESNADGHVPSDIRCVDPASPAFVDARAVVVVVARGTRAAELCDDLDRFGALGSPARWLILSSKRR